MRNAEGGRMTSSNALKCVVSDYGESVSKIGDFTQSKLSGWSQ